MISNTYILGVQSTPNMPKTTAVVKVELDKKLFQREKSKRGGYDYKGFKGEFVCRVGYVDIGHQTSKAGVKVILASGFGTYSQKFKFATGEEATQVALQILVLTGHAKIPRGYLQKKIAQ